VRWAKQAKSSTFCGLVGTKKNAGEGASRNARDEVFFKPLKLHKKKKQGERSFAAKDPKSGQEKICDVVVLKMRAAREHF
jgi:hypothetical protein